MKIKDIIVENKDADLIKRIKSALDKMDPSDPEATKLLHYLKGNIYTKNLDNALKNSGISKRVRPAAYDWFVSKLESLKTPLESKIHLIKMLDDNRYLIPENLYTSNTNGNILNHINKKILTNLAFKEMLLPLWKFKIGGQGGMGPGEAFLILLSANGKEGSGRKGGDLSVGDWKIELKNGGVVPPGDSGKKVVDKLNAEMLTIAQKTSNAFDKLNLNTRTSLDSGWLVDFFLIMKSMDEKQASKLFTQYLTTLYEGIPDSVISTAYNNLGNTGTEKIIASYIFKMYQDSHQWNSICFVDDNFNFSNLISFSPLPNEISVKLSLKRGGDTNAVADGYAFVDLKPQSDVGSSKSPVEKTKKSLDKTVSTQQGPVTPQSNPKQQQMLQQRALQNAAEDKFISILKNPNNPLTKAWANLASDLKPDAKEYAIELLILGKTDSEVAELLAKDIYENLFR